MFEYVILIDLLTLFLFNIVCFIFLLKIYHLNGYLFFGGFSCMFVLANHMVNSPKLRWPIIIRFIFIRIFFIICLFLLLISLISFYFHFPFQFQQLMTNDSFDCFRK